MKKNNNTITAFALFLVAIGVVEDMTGFLLLIGILTSLVGVGLLVLRRKKF